MVYICGTFLTFWIVNLRTALRGLSRPSVGRTVATIVGILVIWLLLQATLAYNGFYLNTDGVPPRFLFGITPALIAIAILLFAPRLSKVLEAIPLSSLTYLHTIRVGVELVMWALHLGGVIPKLMTFDGWNLDIVVGLTAPVVGYLCFTSNTLSPKVALVWHIIGAALLVNVAILFVFSVASPFRIFAGEHPNVGFFYFPFIWAPTFGVPTALLCHCIAIKKLLRW